MDYNNVIVGGVQKRSGPADQLKIGSGHEVKSVTLPVYDELSHYVTLKNAHFVSGGSSLDNEILKNVTEDENGTEVITYMDKAGNVIAKCLADASASISVNQSINTKYSSYTLTAGTGIRFSDIIIESQDIVEVYNSANGGIYLGAASGNTYKTVAAGNNICVTSNKPFNISYNQYTTVGSVEIFSKFKQESVNSNYINNYYDFHLQTGHGLSVTGTNASTSNVILYNLENGSKIYEGLATAFTWSGLSPGFYRLQFDKRTNLNNNYYNSSALTVAYTQTYGKHSYNFYDLANRPIAQTAPKGVNLASSSYPNFTTTFSYNTLNWLLSVDDPDRGLMEYVYQKDGQVRFSQNALQRAATNKRFSYNNYDKYNRLIESGEYTSTASGDHYFHNMKDYFINGTSSIPSGYASIFAVLDNEDGLDDTKCGTISKEEFDLKDAGLSSVISGYTQRNVNGRIAKSSNSNIIYWYSYDERGRVEWTVQQLAGTTGTDFSSTASDRVKAIEYV